jgi:hypothetical protein
VRSIQRPQQVCNYVSSALTTKDSLAAQTVNHFRHMNILARILFVQMKAQIGRLVDYRELATVLDNVLVFKKITAPAPYDPRGSQRFRDGRKFDSGPGAKDYHWWIERMIQAGDPVPSPVVSRAPGFSQSRLTSCNDTRHQVGLG